MCGRFNVTSDPLNQLIVEITGRGFVIDNRLNLAPTEQVPVLVRDESDEWDLRDMRWWLVPYWSDGPAAKYSMFNAKSETLSKSRAFAEPFVKRRCILPVSGYYEWRKESDSVKGSSGKVPYYITPRSGEGFAFAGLWDRWRGNGQVVESCTIITAAAPDSMKGIHHRIPVHLTKDEVQQWMTTKTDPAQLKSLLGPTIRIPLTVTPVSTYVNNARNKDERCLEPIADSLEVLPSV